MTKIKKQKPKPKLQLVTKNTVKNKIIRKLNVTTLSISGSYCLSLNQ